MKKIIFGLVLLSMFSLSACGNNEKKEASSSSKVEQLESRVKELESSSSSEVTTKDDENKILSELKSETNKKIVSAFLDDGLKMYVNGDLGVHELDPSSELDSLNPAPESGQTFYIKNVSSGFEYIISTYNYTDSSKMDSAVDNLKMNEFSVPGRIAINRNINSFMRAEEQMDEKDFDKYKNVFENIK